MNLRLIRLDSTNNYTRGVLKVNKDVFCFTLEDEYRAFKVKGETRIPSGKYKVDFLKVVTPLTETYRRKYGWFEWHLEIKDIPNFSNVYFHVGNTDRDTDGCPLLGYTWDCKKKNFIGDSRTAYKDFYRLVSTALNRGEKVELEIVAI